MAFSVHPATSERFDDLADVINPNRRATHCWCLSHRLTAKQIAAFPDRESAARDLATRPNPAGVLLYDDELPVGWCSITPRSENPRLSASRLIRPIDEQDVWSIICVVVRGGHRRRGLSTPLIDGAVEHAFAHGAPAVEAYPVDNDAADGTSRIDTTMAFVGTRSMFEQAGFEQVGTTDAKGSGLPRIVMRRTPS
ncbi:N-acetyltransferase [Nocardioides sp. R-C-SC26]|uniref:GNAT family N-acetyltransferase n=1 Tax=Nocardioides sp. R-C-SC26 TaxID=2870414 RepID=UPI001E350237|nr:GNAT family N-acetyltransferase [Nocardioides sp. R-C-SC26]